MIQIDVQADIRRALDKLARIPREVEAKAVPRALNKVADQAKVQAAREIRIAGYNIKIGQIKKALERIRATASRKTAVLRAIGKPLNLIHYDARQVKNGVTVSVKNGRKLVAHAFITTYKGTLGVFERVPGKTPVRVPYVDASGKKNNMQFPIRGVYGPSIPTAFVNEAVQNALISLIREKFPDLLAHEIKYLSLK